VFLLNRQLLEYDFLGARWGRHKCRPQSFDSYRLACISHHVAPRGPRDVVRCDVFNREARPQPPVPSADGAREPRSRREEESMPEHRRRQATKRSAATPIGPKGCGGMAPPSSLLLLGDGGTSPSSPRLESGAMALATDDAGGCGRASRGAESYLTVRRAPRSEKTLQIAAYRGPR
jgi:hypothetical protein